MKETYRLHQAAYLMVDREPPPDEFEEVEVKKRFAWAKAALRSSEHAWRHFKSKAVYHDVESFLRLFLKKFAKGEFEEIKEHLNAQSEHLEQLATLAVEDPGRPININALYPVLLSKEDLRLIAKRLGINPVFLMEKNPEAKIESFFPPDIDLSKGQSKLEPIKKGEYVKTAKEAGFSWKEIARHSCPKDYSRIELESIEKNLKRWAKAAGYKAKK